MTEKLPRQKTDTIIERQGSLEEETLSQKVLEHAKSLASRGLYDDAAKQFAFAEEVGNIEKESRTDKLTGLLNRRGFDEEVRLLEAIFARGLRDNNLKIPTTLLTIDIDGFKEVNDKCGHECGDACLQLIAKNVQKELRSEDIFARIGGDEFSIFLSRDNEEQAKKVAEKVRSIIENAVVEELTEKFPSYEGGLSASIGIASISDGEEAGDKGNKSVKKAMKHADYAAYVTKAAGKRGELTLSGAREIDVDGQFEKDFFAGKELPR